MSDAPIGNASELTYPLDYNLYTSAVYNQDFKGPGHLVIRSDGPTYIFSGRPRKFFGPKSAELTFQPADICNVVVSGRALQFKTSLGVSGKKQQPFVAHFRTEADAQAVAALLPRTVDAERQETEAFSAKLAALGEPKRPWESPTNVIIALNIVGFVIMGLLGAGWVETESMMPYVQYAANNGAATTGGEWWRLVTSMFAHYGVIHLALNMWALLQAGHFAEKILGRWPFTLAYFASGLAGGFGSILWHRDQSWSAGASGAVFGVYGVILGYMLREKQALPKNVYQSLMRSTVTFAGYNIVYGMAKSGIDNAAHIGGLLGGIAFGWLLALPIDLEIRRRDTARRLRLGFGALAVLVTVGVVATPRFNYTVSEELAWEETNRRYVPQEADLMKREGDFIRNQSTAGDTAFADWIDTNLIPFYEDWNRKITALPLDAGKLTAQRRKAFVDVLDHVIKNHRTLAAGLRANDKEARSRFKAEDDLIAIEVQKLKQFSAN